MYTGCAFLLSSLKLKVFENNHKIARDLHATNLNPELDNYFDEVKRGLIGA